MRRAWRRSLKRQWGRAGSSLFLVAAVVLTLHHCWSLSSLSSDFPHRVCSIPPSLGTTVTKAFYINFKKSTQRRLHMEKELSPFSFPIRRWEALVPTESEIRMLRLQLLHPSKGKLKGFLNGMLGVRKTNIRLLHYLYREGRAGDLFLVFEDDVIISPYFEKLLPCVLQAVPQNWDTIRFDCVEGCQSMSNLGYPSMGRNVFRAIHNTTLEEGPECYCDGNMDMVSGCWFCGGGFATLHRHDSLSKVIALWESYPIDDHDCELTTDRLENYCVNWDLVHYTNNFGTTVPKNK